MRQRGHHIVRSLLAPSAAFPPWVTAVLNHVCEFFKPPIVVPRNLVQLKRRSVRVTLFDVGTTAEPFDRVGKPGARAYVVLACHFFVGRSRSRALTVLNCRRKRERQGTHQRAFRADQVLGSHVELLLFDGRSVQRVVALEAAHE